MKKFVAIGASMAAAAAVAVAILHQRKGWKPPFHKGKTAF